VVTGVGAGGTVLALLAGLVVGGGDLTAVAGPATVPGAVTASPFASPAPEATLTPGAGTAHAADPAATIAPATTGPATPIIRSNVAAADGAATGPVTGGTTVTLTGTDLTTVAAATFGDNPAEVVSATPDTLTLHTPAATDLDPGNVAVSVFSSTGEPVPVAVRTEITPEDAVTDAAAADALSRAVESSTSPAVVPADPAVTAPAATPALTFTYVPDPGITAQLDYALAHWEEYNSAEYGVIRGNDCVNFTSQSLIARGWAMDADWSYSAGEYSTAWASSTAFAAYLAAHPERAIALTDEQRIDVKVGDIVQFDWDRSGDRDHTGIVSRVVKTGGGVEIYYAGHTANTQYHSVDESLANTGGTVSYWSVV
jgi:hypothetical protein